MLGSRSIQVRIEFGERRQLFQSRSNAIRARAGAIIFGALFCFSMFSGEENLLFVIKYLQL